MMAAAVKDSFTRNVTLLTFDDCGRRNENVYIPRNLEKIRRSGQYKPNVQFLATESEVDVKETLKDAFPAFDLNVGFSCAKITTKSSTFDFCGEHCIWNGRKIRKEIRGNSVLYIILNRPPNAIPNLNQSLLSDSSASVMVQNSMQPPNAADGNPDFDTLMDLWDEEMLNSFDNDEEGTSDISNIQPPNQGISSLNSFEMFDCPAGNDGSTSGVCDHNSSSDDLSTHEDEHFNFTVEPNKVPLEGAGYCRFESDRKLPGKVLSGFASFENLGAVEVDRFRDKFLIGMEIPPAQQPGWVKIYLKKADDKALGETYIKYYDKELEAIEVVVQSPRLLPHLLRKWAHNLDTHNTTTSTGGEAQNFGICDDLSTHEDEHFNFTVEPNKVPLEGAGYCRFESDRKLPGKVLSGFASFENLGAVEVDRFRDKFLIGMEIPPAQQPGWVKIYLKKADDKALGETYIKYYDKELEAIEVVVQSPRLLPHLLRKWAHNLDTHNTTTSTGGEAQNFGICGCKQPVQMLCVLVYAAAEIGGHVFIEMIFNSSAGRVVYDLYKDRSALPEAIARDCGHEKRAIYIEEITKRFSLESDAPNYQQTIDWSELVRAAEEAQKQPGLSSEQKSNHLESNVVKDTGYLGDIDTSSNESCESVSSESEDNIPLATSKEVDYLADELSENALVDEDQECGIKKAAASQSLTSFSEIGHFNRQRVNCRVSNKVVLATLRGRQLSIFQDSFLLEAHGLKHLKGLNKCDTSFFFGSEAEGIQSHLITEYERWFFLFNCIKDNSLHNQTFAVEYGQFLQQTKQETQAVMMGASSGCVEDIPCLQSTRELLTTSDNPELAVQWNTTQGSTKHSTSNVWVLTCLYRPARNILFVYVADNSDVFPHKAYFDDDGYELSTQRWQWQRYSGSLFNIQSRLQELRKLSEQMRPEFGPTPLPTCSAKQILPQVQGKHVLRQPECCPTWLYTMVRQCLVYAPEERQPLIAIFDAISS
ncbi:hypothetical protein AWC38_SpisGene23914, partial [Stylophora pistillata]